MQSGPFFSVIIPTYNRERLLLRTLGTVLGQTFTDYEILVVDNCSTDRTEDVLRPYVAAGKVRFLKHDRNYERACSRNTGLENAAGRFVTFLDSDDLMYPDNLADAHAYALAHADVPLFQNLYELVDEGGRILHRYRVPSLRDPVRAIAEGNFLSCIGVFLRRDFYQRFRFSTDPALTGSEDWDYWLRVVPHCRVGRINRVNSGIVHHGARTVTTQRLAAVQERIERLVRRVVEDRELAAVYRPHLRRMESSSLVFLASTANSGGQYRQALGYLRAAVRKEPGVAFSLRFLRALQIAALRIDRGI
jgi:glycosyltransferase involved in cell wall biosynthesis